MKKSYYSPKRRAIMAKGEVIDHTEVFDAHGWICHICGGQIDKKAGREDWMRVTLDHVIPISRGGTHTWDNVAPAHYICNQNKGNRLTEELDQG